MPTQMNPEQSLLKIYSNKGRTDSTNGPDLPLDGFSIGRTAKSRDN
jgi:hypothetical protein